MLDKSEVLDELGADEWSVDATDRLICPCGRVVEDDAVCPNGHESPLRQAGMI